ncbi:MAG: ATP-binding protein [Rhizobiaceae bacterium]
MPENYLPMLLDGLQEAVFILDRDRIVLSANPAAEQIFGPGRVGQDFVKVSRHPDCISAIGQVLSGAQKSWQVTFFDNSSKSNLQFNVTGLGDDNRDGARILVCVQDVSEMHEAEQMRSDFVANVSHELRSPLTALSGFIETIGMLEDHDSKDRNRFLGLMDMEAQRMIRLISDLLSLSKVESRQRQRPEGSANIISIIERVQNTLVDLAAQEEKNFELSFDDRLLEIPGSEDELTQVFQNLIENAVKYGRRNSHVRINVSTKSKVTGLTGEAVVVEIQDEGEGIAQHHIPRLTERFYRVDTHRSRNKGGTGLGLAIVKHIINRHRGKFSIDSQEGVGSRFIVSLPMTYPISR